MSDSGAEPPEQGSPRGAMDPPATPGPGRRAKAPTSSTPAPSPAPSTPGRRNRPPLPGTPRASSSPFPTRAPRTPGGSSIQPCTVDETLYSRVTVHTAKCTECDHRNKDTMRRCPGCTFQVCQPCYEKRLRNNRGLIHGNMATPGAAGSGLGATNVGRTVRRRPLASSTPVAAIPEQKNDVVEEEQEEVSSATKETVPATQKSSVKKRPLKKRPIVVDSEMDESSEDNFEPDDHSPTPGKKRRTELTFAESALATATRTPPATRATRRSLTAPVYRAPSSPPPDTVNAESSNGFRSNGYLGGEYKGDKDLYDVAIGPYNEPLLGRREPVLSNPACRIPDIIKRAGKPRSEGRTWESIDKDLQAKLRTTQPGEAAQEEAVALAHEQSEKKVEYEAYSQTIEAFVELEAAKYQNKANMDEDDNKAIFNAMESAALVWGKQTYKKLDPGTQSTVQPGLKLRLDRIDKKFREELVKLMEERASSMLSDLGVSDEKSATGPPDLLFKSL